jgi:hypothetical protein
MFDIQQGDLRQPLASLRCVGEFPHTPFQFAV